MLSPLQVVLPVLKDIEAKHSKAGMGSVSSAITTVTLEYVAAMCSTLIQVKNFDIEDWETVSPIHINQICCTNFCTAGILSILACCAYVRLLTQALCQAAITGQTL